MYDYEDIGLTTNLRAQNGIAGRPSEYVNNLNFDQQYELSRVSMNKIEGGTLVLGGTQNSTGLLSLRDSGGTERVKLDNTGIAVTGGSINIQDSLGSTILDSLGVVSTTNFGNSETVGQSLNQIFSGTTVTDVTGGSMSAVFSRTTNVLFLYRIYSYHTEPSGTETTSSLIDLNVNGSIIDGIRLHAGNIELRTYSNYVLMSLPAGTIPVKLVGYLVSPVGSATMTLNNFKLTYLKLGN